MVAFQQTKVMELNELTVLNGGVEVAVTLRDGSKQTVKVQQLSIRKLDAWLKLTGKEPEQVELCCAQEPEWCEQVVPDDYEVLVGIMETLNRPMLDRWMMRVRGSIGHATDLAQKGIETKKAAEGLVQSALTSVSAPA